MIPAMAGVVGLVASALILTPGAANAQRPVAPEQAGAIEVWGATDVNSGVPISNTYPAVDGPWTAVASGDSTFAIDTRGALKRLGGEGDLLAVPSGLTSVQAVSTYTSKAAAVKTDGSVQIWGDSRGYGPQTLSPATLGAKATDVAVSTTVVVILLEDGRVGAIFANEGYRIVQFDGAALDNAAQIAARGGQGYARLTGGGVVSWTVNGPDTSFPAGEQVDQLADPVADFAVGTTGVVAVTNAGSVRTWNNENGEPLGAPGSFSDDDVDGTVKDVTAAVGYFAALTDTNEVAVWGQFEGTPEHPLVTTVPETVDGRTVAQIVGGRTAAGANKFAAIVTPSELSATATPTIAGAATVGATLTGTPATFVGPRDSVTNRWLANGTPIAGANGTTYALTAAELGKSITFQSTATHDAEPPVVSTSTAVGPVVDPTPAAVASTTTVTAAASTYGAAGTVTVAVGNTAGKPVAGTVTLSGAGAVQTAAVAGGKATFALDKALVAGTYTLTAAYSGSAALNPSAGTSGYTVNKGKSSKPVFKASKVPTSKKKGKATVTVGTGSGLAKASGKATVTLKKGKTTKKITVTLSGGKKSISLPKLKKGTWKVQVSYNGDKNYGAQKSKSYNLKIKK